MLLFMLGSELSMVGIFLLSQASKLALARYPVEDGMII